MDPGLLMVSQVTVTVSPITHVVPAVGVRIVGDQESSAAPWVAEIRENKRAEAVSVNDRMVDMGNWVGAWGWLVERKKTFPFILFFLNRPSINPWSKHPD